MPPTTPPTMAPMSFLLQWLTQPLGDGLVDLVGKLGRVGAFPTDVGLVAATVDETAATFTRYA